ncbi:unnamed protein product, partial [Effrenium voratum]
WMDLAFWAFERLLEGRVLLVLCNAGQVRSPTTAALMLRHNCYFSEAVEHIKTIRDEIKVEEIRASFTKFPV